MSKEHMDAVAKRMTKRIRTQGEAITKHYLLSIGWTNTESEYIVKKAKSYMEKEQNNDG